MAPVYHDLLYLSRISLLPFLSLSLSLSQYLPQSHSLPLIRLNSHHGAGQRENVSSLVQYIFCRKLSTCDSKERNRQGIHSVSVSVSLSLLCSLLPRPFSLTPSPSLSIHPSLSIPRVLSSYTGQQRQEAQSLPRALCCRVCL